jgi:pyruvate dehydrogenase E2 component (dihydrolipoamide acetyltransferase)
MATEIKMPQLSDTMSSGKILSWKKNEGDTVKRGDILAEVETEKANLEIESFQQGTLLKILVPAGTMGKVGDAIAVIGQPGEQVAAPVAAATPPAVQPAAVQHAPVSAPPPRPSAPVVAAPASIASNYTAPRSMPIPAARMSEGERIKASPLARKMAEERNIDLSAVRGSGPEGRIVKRDIEQANGAAPQLSVMHGGAAAAPQYHPQQPAPARSEGGPLTGTMTPMSKMREVIARRMQESVTQSPHFYVTTSIEMSAAKSLYAVLKERPEFKGISLNHLVIKAVAYGIANEPRVNRTVRDGQIFTPDSINVGIITAIDDGLLIPVVKDADKLQLKDLVFEARAAVERARAGRPSAADLTGGTFSVSNMGMYDVENFTAIINPGQGSVLAVSSALEQPIVKNGQLSVGLMMKATISVDHRIIDGLMAATFLKHFKAALETPALLLL